MERKRLYSKILKKKNLKNTPIFCASFIGFCLPACRCLLSGNGFVGETWSLWTISSPSMWPKVCYKITSIAGRIVCARKYIKSCSDLFGQRSRLWFQKISIPLPRIVLPIRPLHPLGISVPEGSCITPPTPQEFPIFLFMVLFCHI